MQNISQHEITIRIILGTLLVGLFVHLQLWWALFVPAVLIATAMKGSCVLYTALGINEKEAKQNFYLAQIPRYNPEPVYLFDKNGALQPSTLLQ